MVLLRNPSIGHVIIRVHKKNNEIFNNVGGSAIGSDSGRDAKKMNVSCR